MTDIQQEKCIQFDGTDIKVCVQLKSASMRIDFLKSDVCVHSVVIDHAADPIENSWLADLFAREDHVELRDIAKDVDEYLMSTNTNQG
jgi:hypothetical protein